MGEIVEFASNGSNAQGYLATPPSGNGPGVLVIQEWWGLVDHIKDVVDRFAAEGFVALAPDLYNGKSTKEPDEAAKEMMALQLPHAVKIMSGALDELERRSSGGGLGVIGFCMGGGLALIMAAERPDVVKAVVPCYGVVPWPDAQPDYSKITGVVRGHYASDDGFFGPDLARGLETQLRDLGIDAQVTVHEGVDHAFFNNERPEVYNADAAAEVWSSTLELFHATLGH